MIYQSIPFAVIAAILAVAVLRRREISALSVFALGGIALNFFCAIFLHLRPRSGRPFSDLSAMVFLGVAYGLLCLPLLFVKKSGEDVKNDRSETCELSATAFLFLSFVLISLTVPVSLCNLVPGGKWLWQFSTTDVTREALRQAQGATGKSALQELGFVLESFSFCALFLSAVGIVWFSRFRIVNTLLMLGGLAPVFWSYSTVARNVAMHEAVFYVIAILQVATMRPKEDFRRRQLFLNSPFLLFAFCVTFPFLLITALRFIPAAAPSAYKTKATVVSRGSNTEPSARKTKATVVSRGSNTEPSARKTKAKAVSRGSRVAPPSRKTQGEVVYRGSNKEGLFYSSYSYFCTGAYSFNADYVARYEKGLPCFRGALTAGPVVKVIDVLTGSHITKDAETLFKRLHLAPRDEFPRSIYRDISGAYAGEFKTMIGNIVYDYPKWGAILFCALVSLGAFLVFTRMKCDCLAYRLFTTLYVDTLLFGLLLWPWRSVRQGLVLFWILALVAFLCFLRKWSIPRAQ